MSIDPKRVEEIVGQAVRDVRGSKGFGNKTIDEWVETIRRALSLAVKEDERVVTVEWMHAIHDALGEPCECKHPYLCRPCGLKANMSAALEGDSPDEG